MATHHSKPIPEELKVLLDRFEVYLYAHCPVCKTTADLYLGIVRRAYPHIGAAPSNEDLERYIATLRREARLSATSISAICTGIERFSDFLGHPLQLSRPPKESTVFPHPMSEAEIAILINAAKNLREKVILSVLAYSGMRNKELCSLLVRDVDLGSGLIRVETGKFHKERLCAVPGDCTALLAEYLKERKARPDDLLFVTKRHGYQLEQQDIRKMVRVVSKRAGLKRRIWPHLFRHSLATNLVDRGAHLLTVKDQLGHTFVDSTLQYVHRSKRAHSNDYRQHAPSYT